MATSCAIGAHLSTQADQAQHYFDFGMELGLAFQIIDDLLDNQEGTGKSQGKDLEQGKLTFLSIMSEEDAKQLARQTTEKAFAALSHRGDSANRLKELAHCLLDRNY